MNGHNKHGRHFLSRNILQLLYERLFPSRHVERSRAVNTFVGAIALHTGHHAIIYTQVGLFFGNDSL